MTDTRPTNETVPDQAQTAAETGSENPSQEESTAAPQEPVPLKMRQSLRAMWVMWGLVGVGLIIAAMPSLTVINPIASWATPAMVEGANEVWANFQLTPQRLVRYLGLIVVAGAMLKMGYELLVERFRVEDGGVTRTRGIIARYVDRIAIDDIRSVGYDQSLIGRILGYGTVEFASAGTGGSDVTFYRVKRPDKVQHQIQKRLKKRD